MTDWQATFFATLVDEWVRAGVTDAVICPGNRSTLLSAVMANDGRLRQHVMVDERSGSFFALGLGMATGRPAVFWCTSGTAAVEAHAAIVEAHQAQVPLLVCTADRPPELHHVRDWQSIDQSTIYGNSLRWQFNPGVADTTMSSSWRSIASRAVTETMSHPVGPGPVHLNLPIREPWQLDVGELPPGREADNPWHATHEAVMQPSSEFVQAMTRATKGIIVVGRTEVDAELLHQCAATLGWPVLAEARSGCRIPAPTTIAAADELVRNESFAARCRPEVVLRIGTPVLSKAVAQWLSKSSAAEWAVNPYDVWEGSAADADHFVRAQPNEVCRALLRATDATTDPAWLAEWQQAENAAQNAIAGVIATHSEPTEPGVARALVEGLPVTTPLVAATSMPVRDIEWYSPPHSGLRVFANRGASGMDGVVSTAAGIAVGVQKPSVLLTGDLTFLYDTNALWVTKSAGAPVDLVVVVLDNNGGGIFSMLPQLEGLDEQKFERLVATPHGVDIAGVVAAFDIKVEAVTHAFELLPTVTRALDAGGLRVVYVRTNRAANAVVHQELHDAVQRAPQ